MIPPSTASARQTAFQILHRIDKERSYADILIDQALKRPDLQGPDRGLLTELVYGTLRQQGTLDHLINHFSTQKTAKLERNVLILLRLGLYQILFLDRIPVPAAVFETVALAKTVSPRSAGFINAILRRADRERDALPFPSRQENPIDYLAARYSHPLWIAADWIQQLGMEEAERLARTMSEPAPLTLRTNRLRISREALLARLAEEGATDAAATTWSPCGITVHRIPSLNSLKSFHEGLFMVQDESSQLAGMLLDPRPGQEVLDLCAAPGGKTTEIAELMANRGRILAIDRHLRKLAMVRENAARLGITIVTTMAGDTSVPLSLSTMQYDRVLVDAPCSGLGVIRRNPEGKWWKTAADLKNGTTAQRMILANAATHLKPGGVLLYSTCSTSTHENEEVVAEFLSRHKQFMLERLEDVAPELSDFATPEGYFRSWPHRHGMDGFFAARLTRKEV